MEFYTPIFTNDKRVTIQQSFLNQVLLPQISDYKSDISKFFNSEALTELEQTKIKTLSNKIISLSPKFNCRFESEARHSKTKDRDKHVEFMENIKPDQLAVLYPYARFYVIDTRHKSIDMIKKNAVPISFGKAFDTDFFLDNKNKISSRGEGAGLISIGANRIYDITGDFDPITLNASFFFSSYNVFVNKPAIEKSQISGLSYKGNLQRGPNWAGFFNKVEDITYKELVKRRKEFKLLLEYGWTYNEGVSDDILSREEKSLIDKFEKVYYRLSPKDHKINFNPDGSFTLDVEYVPAPLEKIEITTDFKDGMLSFIKKSDEFSKKITKIVEDINRAKTQLGNLPKTKTNERTRNNLRNRIKFLQKKLKTLQDAKSAFFSKEFLKLAKSYGCVVNYKSKVSKKDQQYNIDFELSIPGTPPAGVKKTFRKSYSVSEYYQNIVDYIKQSDELTGEDTLEELQLNEEITGLKVSETLLDSMLKEQNTSGSFLFFKDILRLVFLFSTKSQSFTEGEELPHYVLGNIAYPLPGGRKFWCNVGDLIIDQKLFLNFLEKFFRVYPNGSPKKFINFFTQKVIPQISVNRRNKVAFPRLSSPMFAFDASKFDLDAKKNIKIYTDLSNGNEKVFEKFCADYFDESKFSSSTGCFFLGQTNNLFYENSKIFISSKISAFKENFYKNDKILKDLGIGKLILGKSNGLLKTLRFSSNSDDAITNLSYTLSQLKPGIADEIASTNYQYSLNAELFGNRIFDFSNLIYIPSDALGKTPPKIPKEKLTPKKIKKLREEARTNDFEIGGLYTVSNVTDNLNLAAGVYTKSIVASCLLRDSALVLNQLNEVEKGPNKNIIVPSTSLKPDILSYTSNNSIAILGALDKKLEAIFEDSLLELAEKDVETSEAEEELTGLAASTTSSSDRQSFDEETAAVKNAKTVIKKGNTE